MKHIKDLKVTIALFQGMVARTDIAPEQKNAVRKSITQLRRLARKRNLTREEAFRCIREVSETLWEALGNNNN